MVIPPEFLLLLRRVFAILGSFLFQMNLQIALSNSVKNWVGILIGIALNLKIAFSRIAIFTVMILLIRDHGRSFLLLRSSSISLFRDLKFLSYRSFTSLVRVTPRYFILFMTIVKGVVSNWQMGPYKIASFCKAKDTVKRQKGHQQIGKGFLPNINLIGD